jgi:hypothetical protein
MSKKTSKKTRMTRNSDPKKLAEHALQFVRAVTSSDAANTADVQREAIRLLEEVSHRLFCATLSLEKINSLHVDAAAAASNALKPVKG